MIRELKSLVSELILLFFFFLEQLLGLVQFEVEYFFFSPWEWNFHMAFEKLF